MKLKNIFFISIFLLIFPFKIDYSYSQEDKEIRINAYFEKALKLSKFGHADESISMINKILEADKHNAPAYNVLAKIYINLGSPNDLSHAENTIRKAIKYAPNNPDYHITYVNIVIAQGFKENAAKYLEKILMQFPNNVEMLYLLSNLYHEYYTKLQNLVSGDPKAIMNDIILKIIQERGHDTFQAIFDADDSSPTIFFDKFAREQLIKTHEMYKKVTALDSSYKDTDRYMTILAYRTEDWNEMIRLSKHWIQRDTADYNGYLFLGLGYLRSTEYAGADSAFQQFTKRLHRLDRMQFDYFDQFLSSNQQQLTLKLLPFELNEFRENFWKSRDPLYMTDYNERKLEHYGRVAEATLLFSSPDGAIEGWKTDRGKIWVRYGPPVRRIKNLNFSQTKSLTAKLSNPDPFQDEDLYEFWYYNNYVIMFYEFPLWSGRAQFVDSRNWSTTQFVEQLQKRAPETYTMKIEGKQITFPYYALNFRGNKGTTRVEIFYEFPINGFIHKEENGKFIARAKQGTFLFNKYWNEVERNERELKNISPVYIDSTSKGKLFGHNNFDVYPGQYHMAIEVMDRNSKNVGTVHAPLEATKYSYDSLQISDILLATSIEPKTSAELITIDNLNYTPQIDRTFKKPQTIFLYFEIYNLQVTGVPGNNKYQLEYSVQYKKSENDRGWSVSHALGRLFSFSKNEFELATTAEYKGLSSVENMYIELDPASLDPGMYQLNLQVIDQLANKVAEKKTVFYLRE